MISPTKHTNPDATPMRAATLMLDALNRERILGYEELRNRVRQRMAEVDFVFLPALDLLYCLGLVEYRSKTDSFEFVGAR